MAESSLRHRWSAGLNLTKPYWQLLSHRMNLRSTQYSKKSVDLSKNFTLRIILRIFFRQINPWQVSSPMMRSMAMSMGVSVPASYRVGAHRDADDNPHLMKEWTGVEWTNFLNTVNTQANCGMDDFG